MIAGPAAALGLGQIQVKSKPGQPLLAEIPIISSDPTELQGLQVQLASADTFSRVGLEPPQGLVSSLHFEPALDASGHPVVRVTSEAPVQQPMLTFLLEVDWGQGRLVREYSALVDVPRTVAAPLQPPIQAPVVAPTNTIVRPPAPVAVRPPAAPATTNRPAAATVVPAPVPVAKPVAAPPAPVEPAPSVAGTGADTYGPVRPGQTLGEIAAALPGAQHYSAAQTMLALLRANPDAFIGGNINQLKTGAVLHLPPADELTSLDRRQAAALVHEQNVQWRGARQTSAQPVAASAPTSVAEAQRPAGNTAKPTRTSDARLEIVPPSGRAANQARQSGIEAGGEGDMLRQQLQETKETLAARDAEVNELKTRVAELEKLQQQQQQLLTMKDSALAAAQQNLAKANNAPAAPAVATTQSQPVPAPQPQAQASSIWLWGGLVLVLTALVGWLFSRRRPRTETPRRSFDTDALAASMTTAATGPRSVVGEQPVPASAAMKSKTAAPVAAAAVTPPWHAPLEPEVANDALPAEPSRQLEQAQAYLDLGDEAAARALLRDVLNGRDPAARDQAARLLRDL